jgi:hypothetical protein
MNVNVEDVYEILAKAANMPHCDSQIALAEEAVRLADLCGNEQLQVDARSELISAGTFGGEQEKALVAYTWVLKKFDENPEIVDAFELMWRYKWILSGLYDHPGISRERIDAIFADAAKRYQQFGISLRPIYGELCYLETRAGNYDQAEQYYYQWLSEPVDDFADCYACEVNKQVECFADLEADENALKIAEPILQGELKCSEIPHLTLGEVLLPLLRQGKVELAAEYFTKGYKLISKNKEFLPTICRQIEFLVWTGNINKALNLFERHFNWALETKNLERKYNFFRVAAMLFAALENETLKLNLPANYKGFSEDGNYRTVNLFEEFYAEAERIAKLFDARNGNDKYKFKLEAYKTVDLETV